MENGDNDHENNSDHDSNNESSSDSDNDNIRDSDSNSDSNNIDVRTDHLYYIQLFEAAPVHDIYLARLNGRTS